MQREMTRMLWRAAHALAATAVLAAGEAKAAGTIVPEAGIAFLSRAGQPSDGGPQLGLGYYLDNGVGARALWLGGFGEAVAEGMFGTVPERQFRSFFGAEVVDRISLHEQWSMTIGAGIGGSRFDVPTDSTASDSETGGIATVGLQWKPATHYAMSLEYSYLTAGNVGAVSLLFQVPL
jgi:hypothetical protein